MALRINRKIDHHDGVFLDNADQQDDAYDADHAQTRATDHQGQQSANAG